MRLSTLFSLGMSGRAWLLLSLVRLSRPFYRLCFLASASSSGILRMLARGPVSFDRIASELVPDPACRDALTGWLKVGCALGELQQTSEGYVLRGYLARRLAESQNDDMAAFFELVGTSHSKVLLEGLRRLKQGKKFTFDDYDRGMVARGSRIAAPFICEVMDRILPRQGPYRILDVGCGSGIYLRHATTRNADLTAVGIELEESVARIALDNLRNWGILEKASIEQGNILHWQPQAEFDLVTLHNGIYYFPVADRLPLLRHLRRFVRPAGRILLTTNCQGGGTDMKEVLSFLMSATEGCGRLPTVKEMLEQLEQAQFTTQPPIRLIPTEPLYAFIGGVGSQ